MAKVQEFYKGRRKKRNVALIPIFVIFCIIVTLVIIFYSLQKYAVISKDSVKIELPILTKDQTTVDSQGNEVKVFDTVDAQVVYDETDYSYIKATAGKNVPELRAIFVPSTDLNREKLQEYSARLSKGNALVLEMKGRNGVLMWDSKAEMAQDYALSNTSEIAVEMPTIVQELKEKDIYLVAQISCCLDEQFGTRSASVSIRRADNGANFVDDKGTWLDPYSLTVRNYIAQLAMELYDMGFDEVALADISHPAFEEDPVDLLYTRELNTTATPVTATCGFAVNVAKQLKDRGDKKLLSIYVDSSHALVKPDDSGQDATLFFKLYDRIFLRTDKYTYTYNVEDVKGYLTTGKVADRLCPVVQNYLPDNSSWVLVDVDEED